MVGAMKLDYYLKKANFSVSNFIDAKLLEEYALPRHTSDGVLSSAICSDENYGAYRICSAANYNHGDVSNL